MVQFEWHDGTVKNIHVDLPFLYEYQVSGSCREGTGGKAACNVETPGP